MARDPAKRKASRRAYRVRHHDEVLMAQRRYRRKLADEREAPILAALEAKLERLLQNG